MFNFQSPPPFGQSPDAGMSAPVPPAPAPGMNGIPGAVGTPAAPYPVPQAPPDPASFQYTAETQQDGTVLLRLMNPDGSPGPVVQIVKPSGAGKKAGK